MSKGFISVISKTTRLSVQDRAVFQQLLLFFVVYRMTILLFTLESIIPPSVLMFPSIDKQEFTTGALTLCRKNTKHEIKIITI